MSMAIAAVDFIQMADSSSSSSSSDGESSHIIYYS